MTDDRVRLSDWNFVVTTMSPSLPRFAMTPNRNPGPDAADVDRLFTAFFQSKLPTPFPPAPVVGDVEPARPRARTADHGRLTLAASVAALLGLGVFLSYGPNTDPAPTGGAGLLEKSIGGDKNSPLHKHMPPANK